MPTNLAIDDRLLEQAQRVGRHRTKGETVTVALQEYIEHRNIASSKKFCLCSGILTTNVAMTTSGSARQSACECLHGQSVFSLALGRKNENLSASERLLVAENAGPPLSDES